MKNAAQKTIVSGVNEGRFIAHLREMFSTKANFLAEMMQNARRAGASCVSFVTQEDALEITDNGHGVRDMAALITVAESDWEQSTMDDEEPFGIGFSSVCFAAKSVTVESRGKKIVFCSDDLIAKRPIEVATSDFIGGTRVTLHQPNMDTEAIRRALKKYATGFAIPVLLDGEEVERPHALDAHPGEMTEVGFISLRGVHFDLENFSASSSVDCYCQGLPIMRVTSMRHWTYREDSVLHLDHKRFKPRMPDRDTLIDRQEAETAIQKVVDRLLLNRLVQLKTELPPEVFAEKYWDSAKRLGALGIMNDVDVLPKSVVYRVTDSPAIRHDAWSDPTERPLHHVSKADVESGAVRLVTGFVDGLQDADFAKMIWAKEVQAVFVDKSDLHAKHWAQAHLLDLGEATVRIGGKVLAKDHFSGNFAYCDVKLMESLSIAVNGEWVKTIEPLAIGEEYEERVVLIPRDCSYPGGVVDQLSSFNSDDHYQENDRDQDARELGNLVAIMAGESPQETLRKVLGNARLDGKTNLHGKRFTIVFDEKGNFQVECLE